MCEIMTSKKGLDYELQKVIVLSIYPCLLSFAVKLCSYRPFKTRLFSEKVLIKQN